MDEYLQKYADAFNENFPIFAFMGMSDETIIKAIQKCLDNNKPYDLDIKEGVYY